jgi:hypothetical protein
MGYHRLILNIRENTMVKREEEYCHSEKLELLHTKDL